MSRVIMFAMALLLAASCSLALRRCTQRASEIDDTGRVVSLADGSVLVAPDGTITSVLVDWLRDPSARHHRFEVGGTQFAPGAVAPLPEAKMRLGRLAQMLRAYPKVHLAVIGATNPSSDAESDQRLSEARARLCAELLVAAGVARNRLATSGEGGKHPRYAQTSPLASHNDRVILDLYKTN